jgi:signal transduction histidine kinase
METAVRAVIKNSINFNRDGGEVKVSVRRLVQNGQPWLAISVADTGAGIAGEDVGQIFDTFWQGSESGSGVPRGVGLGLAIAKMVIENHGGAIGVASTSAEGTDITLSLPQ